MDSNMRGDMVALDSGYPALCPLTLQIQIVGAFPTNVLLADVFLLDGQLSPSTTLQPNKAKGAMSESQVVLWKVLHIEFQPR